MKSILPLLLLIIVGITLFFRPLIFEAKLPFPGHLLVSFFSPFKEEAWSQYPAGVPRKDLLGFDTVRMMYPWRAFTTLELKSGRLPTWNPHSFAGSPHLANWQTAVFYPPNLLYLVFSQSTAWTILILLQPLAASLFMFLYLKSLKLKSLPALTLAAVAYGFSGWLAVWLEWNTFGHVYALLPLTLLGIEKLKIDFKPKIILLNLLSLVFIILAGHPQISIFALIFYAVYGLIRLPSHRQRLLIVLSLAILLTAIQWLPTLEYYRQASREAQSLEFNLQDTAMPISQLVTLFAPTFFGHPATGNYWGNYNFVELTGFVGTSIFVLIVLGLVSYPKLRRSFFALSAVAVIIFALQTPLTRLLQSLSLPVLSTSVLSRVLIILPFCLTALAALTINNLSLKFPKFKSFGISVVLILVLVVSLLLSALFNQSHAQIIIRNLVIPGTVAIITLLLIWKRRFWLLSLLILFDLGLFAHKTITFTEAEFIFPQIPVLKYLQSQTGYDRFGAEKASNVEANLPLYYGLSTATGYDALYPRRLGELVWGNNTFSRSTVVIPQSSVKLNQRLMDLLSIKYVIYKNDLAGKNWPAYSGPFNRKNYIHLWQQQKWQVYQNLSAIPRAALFDSFQLITDPKKSVAALLDPNFDPHRSLVLAETPFPKPRPARQKRLTITSYRPTQVDLTVSTDQPQLLLLTDTYYPGWQATIDNIPANIIRANHAFRSLALPAGDHQITFNYRPQSLKLGSWLSLIGILVSATYIYASKNSHS